MRTLRPGIAVVTNGRTGAPKSLLPDTGSEVGRRLGSFLYVLSVLLSAIIKRLVISVPMLVVVSTLFFVVLRLLPADPVGMLIPPNATPEDVEALRQRLGLDGSIIHQYQ